ncbi:MAG: hypothetical protein ACRDSR_14025 [Pseudonocardiaceae bacterium]
MLLVAGACLATLSLTVGSAIADPTSPTGPRQLPGVGSNTTEDVMNGYANGVTFSVPPYAGVIVGGTKIVASYDATGTATITTKNTPECTNIPRPNGSTDGVNALAGLKPGFPADCAEFARSSANSAASRTGQNLTFIPFALDGLTYATASVSSIPRNLTLAQLTSIYAKKTTDAGGCGTRQPLIPQAGSGTRSAWLTLLGLTEATLGDCVKATVPAGSVEENDGRVLTNPNQLVPYSVAQWIVQTTQPSVLDRHGNSVLRAINGESPFDLSDFPGARKLYNVLRNADIGVAPYNTTFVGAGSAICSHPEVLEAYGMTPISDCGSTAIQTP